MNQLNKPNKNLVGYIPYSIFMDNIEPRLGKFIRGDRTGKGGGRIDRLISFFFPPSVYGNGRIFEAQDKKERTYSLTSALETYADRYGILHAQLQCLGGMHNNVHQVISFANRTRPPLRTPARALLSIST